MKIHQSLALVLATTLPAQGVKIPGYDVVFYGSVSVIDVGGKPMLAIVGQPMSHVGLVGFWNPTSYPNDKRVQLRATWAGVYDPLPCAVGGRAWLHVSIDVGQGCIEPIIPSAAVTIGGDGYGLGPINVLMEYAGSMTTPWRLDYSYVAYPCTRKSSSPCGGFPDLMQAILCEITIK